MKLVLAAIALAALAPLADRGRALYTTGATRDGHAIESTLGETVVTTPLPCASCHGEDGRGRAEGGVEPANLEADSLAAYDDAHLRRAITLGISRTGRRLDVAMPRYRLTRANADALVAYLRTLGTRNAAGVADDALTIRVASTARDAAQEWADAINARGGIYARRVALTFDASHEALAIIAGNEAVATGEHVPLIRHRGLDATGDDRWVFETSAGVVAETRAFIAEAAKQDAMPLAIVPPRADLAALCVAPCRIATAATDARSALVLAPHIAMPANANVHCDLSMPDLDERDALLASARVLEAALARAGRGVTRESLVDALEQSYRVETGTTAPVTFTRLSHHGLPASFPCATASQP